MAPGGRSHNQLEEENSCWCGQGRVARAVSGQRQVSDHGRRCRTTSTTHKTHIFFCREYLGFVGEKLCTKSIRTVPPPVLSHDPDGILMRASLFSAVQSQCRCYQGR
ncbi:hypothetical protein J6590_067361 [Homalodisca vitripennis]|nr:hypothetical protein J6590_067361 [Homalodisca vitripennis]